MREKAPVKVVSGERHGTAEQDATHPAFGMIQVNRIQKGGADRLFGSPLSRHGSTIMIRVMRGRRVHRLSEDNYYASRSDEIVELELSAGQFAELITHMNMGDGVPCTLRHVGREALPGIPDDDLSEVERIEAGLEETVRKATERLREAVADATAILDSKGTLKKAERELLRGALNRAVREATSNIPFVAEQAREAVQRGADAIKREADAFVSAVIHRAGLDALAERSERGEMSLVDTIETHKKIV